MTTLEWFPKHTSWNDSLRSARSLPVEEALPRLQELANYSLDFVQTGKLDAALTSFGDNGREKLNRCPQIKLAILGSSTLAHLAPAIRVAALRRGFSVVIYLGSYGMYRQELMDTSSALYAFDPDVVLLSLDAHHLASGNTASVERSMDWMQSCWRVAKEQLHATIIQQTVLPIFQTVLGNNEHLHKTSPYTIVRKLNQELRAQAEQQAVLLLSVDQLANVAGLSNWFDRALWHRSKQEVHPSMSPLYGEQVGRLLGALRGLSSKCLVLDLDNTLWGGVIGDDGVDGISLGQGQALGEAFVSFQRYVKSLAERGVILAVCSKNDETNALLPFEQHPEMVLRRGDIACFVANWQDKVANLREIALRLDIGLDSIVFVDDNPFERNLVRQNLPMVQVPEMPEDPALYESVLAAAGYFESLNITSEDRNRSQLYHQKSQVARLREECTDMASYLRSLNMELRWSSFDQANRGRVTQLINKSNQFNLTTQRYTSEQIDALCITQGVLTAQLSLTDVFGENGIIAVLIARIEDQHTLDIDTWLMSCRVLGRQIEEATLNLIVEQARLHGLKRIRGRYIPTPKNAMVSHHYQRLGFVAESAAHIGSTWILHTDEYVEKQVYVTTTEFNFEKAG